MIAFPRGVAVALSLSVLAGGAACSGCARGRQQGPSSDAGTALGPAQPELGRVLARVGDRTITVADYLAALEHMDQFDRLRYQAPERRQDLLSEMVDVTLLAQEARDRGYDRDPVTEQEIREILRDAMRKRAREGIPPPSAVPEDEARAYYDRHRADFSDPERRRVAAIALSDANAAATTLDVATKATAAEWGELVRTRSIAAAASPNAPLDLAGDLGFVSPPGDPRGTNPAVPEEVRRAAFEIAKVGEVLPRVVPSNRRFYVVKLTGRTDAHQRTFEGAKRAIAVQLTQAKIQEREDALLDELRRQYPVQIDEDVLREAHVELPPPGGDP